jgi:hypothetical protein
VVVLLGVWSWKSAAIPAWDAVTLRGRTAYIAFDSDAASNPKVQHALRRLRAFLGSRGAHVRIVHLSPGPNGEKVGVDDALAGGATLTELAVTSTEQLRIPAPANDARPELDVSTLHRAVVLEAFGHLARAGVYRTPSGLAVVRTDDGPPRVHALTVPENAERTRSGRAVCPRW